MLSNVLFLMKPAIRPRRRPNYIPKPPQPRKEWNTDLIDMTTYKLHDDNNILIDPEKITLPLQKHSNMNYSSPNTFRINPSPSQDFMHNYKKNITSNQPYRNA